MTEKKQSLSGVLNIRVDEALSKEIDRIATVEGLSASEAARKLLGYGVEVQRQVEASYLQLPYDTDYSTGNGRIAINAGWKRWTPRELYEMREEAMADAWEAEQFEH
jgi:hypothetical protein